MITCLAEKDSGTAYPLTGQSRMRANPEETNKIALDKVTTGLFGQDFNLVHAVLSASDSTRAKVAFEKEFWSQSHCVDIGEKRRERRFVEDPA